MDAPIALLPLTPALTTLCNRYLTCPCSVFVNGHAFGAQGAIIPRSLKADFIAAQFVKRQAGKKRLSLSGISVLAE
jgi:hypothetical protein